MDRVNRGFFSNTMRSSRGQLDNFQRGTGGGKGGAKREDERRRRASTTTIAREKRSNRVRLFTDGLHKNTTTE